MTPIGLGLAALGRPAYINLGRDEDLGRDRGVEALERRCHEVLDAAYRAGVRYFDAARSYGLAEAFLTSWLKRRNVPPSAVTVGSKWGYTYTGEWRVRAHVHEVKEHSLGMLRRQYEESRRLLGPHLRLYQIHSATLESGVLEDAEVLTELAHLRDQGLVIGCSVSGPRQADVVRRALEVEVDGVNPFACVQATWNVLEPSAGPALMDAHDEGWGIIVKEALANGRLARHREDEEFQVVEEMAARFSVSLDAVAIAAALANEWVDVVLSGAVTPRQLTSNLAALSASLTSDDLARLSALAEHADAYWATRGSLPWS